MVVRSRWRSRRTTVAVLALVAVLAFGLLIAIDLVFVHTTRGQLVDDASLRGTRIGRARIMIDEALKADEELVGAHLVMATVCRLEEQKDKALEHIRIAARLDPENPEVKAARDSLGGSSRTSTQGFRKKESVFDKVRKILKMD